MKTLLYRNIIFGIIGALVAWFISEPWSDKFSYGRDMFIMICLGFFIWFFLSTANYLYYRKFKLLKKNSRGLLYGVIPIIGAIIVKIILTPANTVIYHPDSSTEARIILMDVSSSMEGTSISELKKAVVNYLNILEESRSQDYICLAVFSDDSKTISRFTNDYQSLKYAVNSLSTYGGTNMVSGLKLSVGNLNAFCEKNHSVPGEVILVSDGSPNDMQAVREYVLGMSYPCSTIGVGEGYNESLLKNIANTTKGVFYPANDIVQLTGIFQKIASGNLVGVSESNKNMPLWRRLVGWGLLGLVIGLGIGLFEMRKEQIVIGIFGGIFGGVIGAFCLQLISLMGMSGSLGRMISFAVFAVILAVSLWLTERLYTLILPYSTNRSFPTQM